MKTELTTKGLNSYWQADKLTVKFKSDYEWYSLIMICNKLKQDKDAISITKEARKAIKFAYCTFQKEALKILTNSAKDIDNIVNSSDINELKQALKDKIKQ